MAPICKRCGKETEVIDGSFTCSGCGYMYGRAKGIVGFQNIHEYTSVYTRTSRLKKLMRELNGETDIPDRLAEFVWKNKTLFASPAMARATLLGKHGWSKYQNKIPAIMSILGHPTPSLTFQEMDRAAFFFTIVDAKICQASMLHVAFTFIVPIVLQMIDRKDVVDAGFCRAVSDLLWKKYGSVTMKVIAELPESTSSGAGTSEMLRLYRETRGSS